MTATDPSKFPPPLKAKRGGKGYKISAAALDEWVESLEDA